MEITPKHTIGRRQYKAFGLSIASDIELPELLDDHSPDIQVIIAWGQAPATFPHMTWQKHHWAFSRDFFRLDREGAARYFVEKGQRILVEPYAGALTEQIKLYLLGSCMGALLYQRDILPLHGSCVNINGQGVLLTGQSGAGKSTVAAALLQRGHTLITDDVAAVSWHADGQPQVIPSYPSQKLWEDALARMNNSLPVTSLQRIEQDLNKYSVVHDAAFCDEIKPLPIIYELVTTTADPWAIEELHGTDKLPVILNNTYRRFMARGFDKIGWHFTCCARIAGKVAVYRINRPAGVPLEQEIADEIVETLKRNCPSGK